MPPRVLRNTNCGWLLILYIFHFEKDVEFPHLREFLKVLNRLSCLPEGLSGLWHLLLLTGSELYVSMPVVAGTSSLSLCCFYSFQTVLGRDTSLNTGQPQSLVFMNVAKSHGSLVSNQMGVIFSFLKRKRIIFVEKCIRGPFLVSSMNCFF